MKGFTIEDLKELKPCTDGFAWYVKNVTSTDIEEILIQLNNHRPDWSRWLMTRVLNREQNQRLAIFAAESVLDIYEKRHPDDKRARECIQTAKGCLVEKRRAAAYAAYAAAAAVDAAAAADAADAADAAYAAAYAAAAAADAADAADAYANDARKELQEKIIKFAVATRRA